MGWSGDGQPTRFGLRISRFDSWARNREEPPLPVSPSGSARATYLVFGDLHGRILPAFRIAAAYAREHGEPVTAILQVGDLGFFPDASRLDTATSKFAARDPLELGAALVASPSPEADRVFAEDGVPEGLWFTAGNHEDFDALEEASSGLMGTPGEFPVDAYDRVRCVRDGAVTTLPGGLRVAALWGVDGDAPGARRDVPAAGRVRRRSAVRLSAEPFDVLLTHDGPRDAVIAGAGSEDIGSLLRQARPPFAFFGHYRVDAELAIEGFPATRIAHLTGLAFRDRRRAEARSAGVLRWAGGQGEFAYLDPAWLATFTRENWATR